jgi:hypothetical protein
MFDFQLNILLFNIGQDDKGDHIGIYLKLEKNTEINCSDLIMQVSIVNAHKKVFYSKTKAIMPSNEWNENKFGFPQFISHDMIFSKELKEAIFDNKLHLRVGISKVRGGKECLKVSKVINEIPQSIEDELIMNDDDFMSSFEFEGRGCDVIIRTSDNVELKAHKSILEVHSPVFELRFSIENKKDTFDVYEFNVNVVREFLRFCYYQQIQNASPFIFNLLKMALLYENVNLVTHCIQIINENTSFSNVFELLKESETIECLELTNMIANFIKR